MCRLMISSNRFPWRSPKWNLGSRNQLVNEFPLARNLSRHGCRDMRVIEANETENISRSWRKE